MSRWEWGLFWFQIIVIIGLIVYGDCHQWRSPAPPLNQSKSWYGHTGDGWHPPWIVIPKGEWDQSYMRTSWEEHNKGR